MPPLDQTRAKKLIVLAQRRYAAELTETEQKILYDSASSGDPPLPDEKTPRPEVCAAFLRWLATDPEAALQIDPKGLRVYAATITDNLDLRECRVRRALDFRRCTFQKKIDLRSARTRGLFFFESSLRGGMSADRVTVHGPLFLRPIASEGEIRLPSARIEGNLDCEGALLNFIGDALNADQAQVGGSVFLRGNSKPKRMVRFESEGAIRMVGIKIDGSLDCSGAKLKATDIAFKADGARICGGVFLAGAFDSEGMVPFVSEGAIRLVGAEIGWNLMIRGAKVAKVDCRDAVVKGDLIWQRIEKSKDSSLNLAGARVKNLRDDRESWLDAGKLDLDGLAYEELTLHDLASDEDIRAARLSPELPLLDKQRIDWILLQPKERRTEPQPWMQLRDLFDRKGDRNGAKHVLYKLRCLQARKRAWIFCRAQIAFAWLEEAPRRILWFIGATLIVFTTIFWYAGAEGALAPTNKEAYDAFIAGKPLPSAYPGLTPPIYTLENALPLVQLGQDEKWAPDQRFPSKNWLTNYWFLMWARWVLVIWGWFQAGVLGAALVERFKPK